MTTARSGSDQNRAAVASKPPEALLRRTGDAKPGMTTVAIVQARMGSNRLPGKVMLSLDCTPVLRHVVRRTDSAETVDDVVVATTDQRRDDILERYARREGAAVSRGSEDDVLGRMYDAADEHDADIVVRITADNPLLSPDVVDAGVRMLRRDDLDYVSNKTERTFPAGLDVEVFTFESFRTVEQESETAHQREHVTPYYRKSDRFDVGSLTSDTTFETKKFRNRTDLRLTLDTPDDYELFSRIYNGIAFEEILDIRNVIEYVDENDLASINRE